MMFIHQVCLIHTFIIHCFIVRSPKQVYSTLHVATGDFCGRRIPSITSLVERSDAFVPVEYCAPLVFCQQHLAAILSTDQAKNAEHAPLETVGRLVDERKTYISNWQTDNLSKSKIGSHAKVSVLSSTYSAATCFLRLSVSIQTIESKSAQKRQLQLQGPRLQDFRQGGKIIATFKMVAGQGLSFELTSAASTELTANDTQWSELLVAKVAFIWTQPTAIFMIRHVNVA